MWTYDPDDAPYMDDRYVRHVINAIKDQLGRDKIRVVVMNNRGAGGSELLVRIPVHPNAVALARVHM